MYGSRGVEFVLVDSEVGASPERDRMEALGRGYPLPILLDPGAKLARALDAEFATYTVVVDRSGTVRYRGGIDSNRNELTSDATPFLAHALDDLLAGRALRQAETKPLGCALQTW
jgi:hypothetical protein